MIGESPKIAVYLTDEEIELFKQFRRYQDSFNILLNSGALDIISGNVIIHLDEYGHIRKIERGPSVIFYTK